MMQSKSGVKIRFLIFVTLVFVFFSAVLSNADYIMMTESTYGFTYYV